MPHKCAACKSRILEKQDPGKAGNPGQSGYWPMMFF